MATAEVEKSLMLRMLNDDCIFQILEWLPLSDIRSCSKVCRRLQALCSNHAQRKLHETLDIEVVATGYLKLVYQNENVPFFDNFINMLRISGDFDISKWPEQNLLASFVKTKCSQTCTYKIIVTGGLQLFPFFEEIRSVLNNLEIVYFTDETTSGDVSNFLKYCPNLTTLFVSRKRYDRTADTILRQNYPKLKHLHLEFKFAVDPESQLPEALKMILHECNQIECVVLAASTYRLFLPADCSMPRVKCIETVADFASNLQHLFINIDRHIEEHFEQIYGCLKKLCDRSNFKSLALSVHKNILMEHSNRLKNLKQLNKIHVKGCYIEEINHNDGLNQMLSPFVYLKSAFIELGLSYQCKECESREALESVLQSLESQHPISLPPQIEELTILDKFGAARIQDLLTCLMRLIRHCNNLKRLSLSRDTPCCITFPVADLNTARYGLDNAVPITIFFNFPEGTTDAEHELVKFQNVKKKKKLSFIGSERYCMSPMDGMNIQTKY